MAPNKKPADNDKRQVICQNRRARHDFTIEHKLEAGMVLVGTEVKACRAGKVHLNDAYVMVVKGEVELIGGNIAEYSFGNQFNHAPVRSRKLLMHRREIDKLDTQLREKGYTAVPLTMYFKDGRVKVEIAVGKGKSTVDRRDDIKARETQREVERVFRRGSRNRV